ncbi:unnamed protein product [Mytilus edulis]|uniref:Mutator-like transposase domain-containing protein n=1 Tax=Mytilus edulis TaxID=6550 RepID=A0A8S3T2X2_MYTED|nr:unnamed protein product [Mytilus edulis]
MVIHAETRKRDLVDKLYNLGLSISYDRVMNISTAMGNSICEMFKDDDVVCPAKLRCDVFTTAAVDNIDHNPSSTSAKGSLHGTAISLFQHPSQDNYGTVRAMTSIIENVKRDTIKPLPERYSVVPPVVLPKEPTAIPSVDSLLFSECGFFSGAQQLEYRWLNHVRQEIEDDDTDNKNVTWSAFHANLSQTHAVELPPLDISSVESKQKAFVKQVIALTATIEEMGNPFLEESEDLLVLDTRDIVDPKVANTVRNIEQIGNDKYHEYLYVSCQVRDSDLDEFFRHENQAYPPSLSQFGQLRLGSKSDLLVPLEKMCVIVTEIPDVDAIILDGAVIVNILKPRFCKTFEDYSKQVFLPHINNYLKSCSRIDVIWDEYRQDSLKASTRGKRGKGIRRRVQADSTIPGNWESFLRIDDNKTELFAYLAEQLLTLTPSVQTTVVSTKGSEVICNKPDKNKGNLSPCNHEEADTLTEDFKLLSDKPNEDCVNEAVLNIERFVVLMYDRTSECLGVDAARKDLFTRKGRSIENIPPSSAALHQHIKRAAYQAGFCWGQALVKLQESPSPSIWGWKRNKEGLWEPFWTSLQQALTAQGRPVLPRSRSCETFHDLTPTGEISIRVNQDQWPSQENTDRYEKDGIHHTDKRPLSGGLSPSTKVAIDQAKNKEVSNRATVVHLEPNATWPVKQNLGEESSTLYNHAARSRYGFWSQKAEGSTIAEGTAIAEGYAGAEVTAEAKGSAEGDSGNTRRGATSCESRWDSGDLPRTLDRGVLHNMGATYQALPLTSRGRFRVGVNRTDHEHRTDEMTSNLNYSGISNKPIFDHDYDINLQNTNCYKKKPVLYDGETNWEDYLVQFELIAAINKWSDLEKALELATSLRGSAQSILTNLRPEMRTNFVQLTAALASRFQPENQAEMYRAQMKSKIRGRTEQIPVLGQDIKRLVRLAYPSAPMEVRDYLARDCFIDSLNDADMEWAIFQAKAKNIDNAIQVALEYEAFQNNRRQCDVGSLSRVSKKFTPDSSPKVPGSKRFDINVRAVWGSMITGNGPYNLNEFLATLNSPGLSHPSFTAIETEIGQWWHSTLEKDMLSAAERKHGVRYIRVVGDGDSSVFAKIRGGTRLGKIGQKEECANYVSKCYRSNLEKLVTDNPCTKRQIKFLGQSIRHEWIIDETSHKKEWYKGTVASMLSGTDGRLNAIYEVLYEGEDEPFEIDHLIQDYQSGSVQFIDV